MNIAEKIYAGLLSGKSIRTDIMVRVFAACIFSVVIILVGIVLTGFLLTEGIDGEIMGKYLGFEFFSRQFFRMLGIVFLFGTISSVIASICISLPFSRSLKRQLKYIHDANESFSAGNLESRINIKGYNEIEDIGRQFNQMTQRTQKQVESLQRLITENKELLEGAQEAASTEERRRIARELHDAVSQQLFAISTTTSALSRIIKTDPEQSEKYIGMIGKMTSTAQQELRALIMHLRPASLEGHCLKEGIENLLEELDVKHQNIKMHKELNNVEGLSPGTENNIFRVVQEAISNMLRHSKATVFTLKLFQKEKILVLVIEDNGIGMDLKNKKKTSYGMAAMRERIEELGGRFKVISFPGKGTRIEIRVPVGLQSIFKS